MLPVADAATGLSALPASEWVVGHEPSPLSVLCTVLTIIESDSPWVFTRHLEPLALGLGDLLTCFLPFTIIHPLHKYAQRVILDVFVKPVRNPSLPEQTRVWVFHKVLHVRVDCMEVLYDVYSLFNQIICKLQVPRDIGISPCYTVVFTRWSGYYNVGSWPLPLCDRVPVSYMSTTISAPCPPSMSSFRTVQPAWTNGLQILPVPSKRLRSVFCLVVSIVTLPGWVICDFLLN